VIRKNHSLPTTLPSQGVFSKTSINDTLERLVPHKTPIYQAAYWEFESLAENGRVFKKCFFAYFDAS